jgi:hypothetical protein
MFKHTSPAIIAGVLYDRESIQHHMYSKDESSYENKILDFVRNKPDIQGKLSNIDIFLLQYQPSVRFMHKLKLMIPSGICLFPFYGMGVISGFYGVVLGRHVFNPKFGIPAIWGCAFFLGLGALGIWAGNRIQIIVSDFISNKFDKTNLITPLDSYMTLSEIRRRNCYA